MAEALRAAAKGKRKSGRPSKLVLEDQSLLTLMYLRESRTYFHIGHTYGVNASTAYRIVRHVEDVLSQEETFSLPSRRQLQASELEQSFVIVDITETPIKRLKKAVGVLQRAGPEGVPTSLGHRTVLPKTQQEEVSYPKSSIVLDQ